ncbi:MAG: hypothetical protein CL927_16975 [Deltaproteobacteria bacterium]|nr:hypothetical protein [Deltaproteobacteria bacterium]
MSTLRDHRPVRSPQRSMRTRNGVLGAALTTGMLVLELYAATAQATAFPDPVPEGWRDSTSVRAPYTASAARPVPQPATYRDLHVVRDPFLLRWQQATANEMSGIGASPWYRDLSARLDVTWRLAEQAPSPVTIDAAVRDQAFNMVIVGAYSGWSRVWSQTFARAPELVPIQTAIRSALTPSLQIRKDRTGRTRVSSDARNLQNQDAAMADINQGPVASSIPLTAPRTPFVRTGSAMTLIRLPDQSDLDLKTPRNSAVAPELTSWVDVRHVVLDAARVQTRVQQAPDRAKFHPQVRWTALARQGLLPRWDVVAELQSSPRTPLPQRNAIAIEHRLESVGLPAWAVRLAAVQQVREDLGPGTREERVMWTLRNNLAWYLPQDVERWPLGQRPLAPGPTLPPMVPTGPQNPRPLAQSPIKRHTTPPLGPPSIAPPAAEEDGVADR